MTSAATGSPTATRRAGSGLARVLVAEFLGTAGLLVAVVGSGIATTGDASAAAQLFRHAVVVGVVLAVLVVVFLPVSGAHFNPVVSLAQRWLGVIDVRETVGRVTVQVAGAIVGTVTVNVLFGLPAAALGTTARSGPQLWGSEVVATAGLVTVILALVRQRNHAALPWAVGGWVAGAIFATSSMSFANPAVTIARALTDSWTAIQPVHVPMYVVAQLVGLALAVPLVAWLVPAEMPVRTATTAAR